MFSINFYDPYSPGPVTPVTKTGWNIGVWADNGFRFYQVIYLEGIQLSEQMTQDLGAINAAENTSLTEITVANAAEGELVHVRCKPLDRFQAEVSQVRSSAGRFITDSQHSRIVASSRALDPYYALTTMFVLGNQRAIYVSGYNRTDYNIPQSRLAFWGYRYVLRRLETAKEEALKAVLEGDEDKARQMNLQATVVAAAGRGA